MQSQEPTRLWCNAKQWFQKQYFNISHNIDLGLNDEKSQKLWVMGNYCETNEEARLIHGSTLWFTYREHLVFANSQITSDVGWGCMIRVGQMMMAEALRRTIGLQLYAEGAVIAKTIDSFMKNEGLFSIQKMVKLGLQLYGKGAGEWFTPAQTAYILRDIQNRDSSSALRVIVFHGEFQATTALNYLCKSNNNKNKVMTPSQTSKQKQAPNYSTGLEIQPGLIIILVRIGMGAPEPDMLASVIATMKLSGFLGILGGRPGRAHFIMGTTQSNFIYLDPHFVKGEEQAEEFFCSNMFSMPHQKVDTSMALCFHVANYAEFATLSDGLCELKNNNAFLAHSIFDQPKLVEIKKKEIEILK